jgi:hypothetical protein
MFCLYCHQAKEQIKAGDVLILERPYAAVLVPDNKATHCSHCFELLEEDFKYVYCVWFVFLYGVFFVLCLFCLLSFSLIGERISQQAIAQLIGEQSTHNFNGLIREDAKI